MSIDIFELYDLPMWPDPFPRNLLGIYSSREKLIRDFHFTYSEVEALLDGEIVREKYCLEMLPEVMQNLMREDLFEFYGKPTLSIVEIAYELDMSVSAVAKLIYRFMKRQQGNNELKHSLYELAEHKRTRDYTVELKNKFKTALR